MSFQDNLKQYREKAGFSAKDFAKKIGCAYTTYLTYENQGREPKFELLIKIAKALHVSIDDLLGYHPSELEIALQDVKECGFHIVKELDYSTKELVGLNILPLDEYNDEIFFIPTNEFLELYKNVLNTKEAQTLKHVLYLGAFRKASKIQLHAMFKKAENDPECKDIMKKLQGKYPSIFGGLETVKKK